MLSVRELHGKAMRLAVEAQRAHNSGDLTTEADLALQASTLEAEAASQLSPVASDEPTRAILIFSAASLAWQAGDIETCRRLCCDGLRGFPPPEYERDLTELYEKAVAARHFDIKSIDLNPNEFQLVLDGDYIPRNLAPISEITTRLTSISASLLQNLRRKYGKTYSDLRKKIEAIPKYVPFVASFNPGSLIITVGLIPPCSKEVDLPFNGITSVSPSIIVDDFLSNMELLSIGDLSALSKRIDDESYLINFIAHAKEIAPDGRRIRKVGLNKGDRKINFSLSRKDVRGLLSSHNSDESETTLTGILVQADKGKATIGLEIEGETKPRRLTIKQGLEDIVRTYFDRKIEATGIQKKTYFELHSVDPVSD